MADLQKHAMALRLREEGRIFPEIGESLGVSTVRARQLLIAAQRNIQAGRWTRTPDGGLQINNDPPRTVQKQARPSHELSPHVRHVLWRLVWGDDRSKAEENYYAGNVPLPEVIAEFSLADIKRMDNCGEVSANEIRRFLQKRGLDLKGV